MRVGIDAACWSNKRGYGRFTRGLLNAFVESQSKHELVFFIDSQTHDDGDLPKNVQTVVVNTGDRPTEAASASDSRSIKDLLAMTKAVAGQSLDAFFFPSVYTYFPAITSGKIILGVHDVIAEDYPDLVFPDKRHRRLWALKGWLAHKQANYIMTVSEHAKKGIVRHFGHKQEKVFVIDEAPDPVFTTLAHDSIDRSILSKFGLKLDSRFLIYIGGINPHKNLPMLVQSLADIRQRPGMADVKLVIVGDLKDGFTPGVSELKAKIANLHQEDAVIFTGFVKDEDVIHILNIAQALVLPSMAEGFGLPAVEGAACGVPIVATINSPLPELLSDGGIFIDPNSEKDLTNALNVMLSDSTRRDAMAKIATAKAQQMTWQRAAQQMDRMLDQVASKS
ncbi:MAG TPA: glycosyltransferase family 1 protein [Drouetiella sp.]